MKNIIFFLFDTLCDHSDEKTVVLGSSMQKNCNICGQDFSKSSESMCVLILIMDLWSINLKGVVGHKKSRGGGNKIFLYFLKY